MTKTTSPYLDFAKNLRTMTEQRGTIAQVCRELGMNRQQFNKYLSGASLPAPQTLEKIARYFGVDQHAMFDRDDSPDAKSWTKGMHPLFMLGQLNERVLRKFVDTLAFSSKTQLKEGCYLIYYPWPLVPTEILRAAMVVFKVGNVTCFRRYTRFAMKEQPLVQGARERDEGIVLELSGRTFMISKNIRASGELSLYSFAATTTADLGIMSGLALVFSHWAEPLATRVTIDYFGPKDAFRRALSLCRVVPDTASGISETIKRSVLEPVNFPTAHLMPFQIFESIRS